MKEFLKRKNIIFSAKRYGIEVREEKMTDEEIYDYLVAVE